MRPVLTVGGMTLMLTLAAPAPAQTLPYDATVVVPQVDARSGQSTKYYPTNRLHQRDRVTVEQVEGAWLGIKPPAGSCSWIETKSLLGTGPNRIVHEADVKVYLGSTLVNDEPTAFQRRLQPGAQVRVLDEKPQHRASDGADLVPIEPPPHEVRWIPTSAVGSTAALVSTSARPNVPATPASGPGPAAAPAATDDQMWTDAQKTEATGNIAAAIPMYHELCKRTANSNPNLSHACANRAAWLLQGWRDPNLVSHQAARPTDANNPNGGPDRLVPRPNTGYVQYTSNCWPGQAGTPTGSAAPAPQNTTAAYPQPAAPLSYRGYLRRAGFQVDGQNTYALEDSRGQPLLYVSGQVGVNLEPYRDRLVEVFGPVVYRADIRIYHMTASNVTLR
jgi:hypothetical protein